MSSLWWTLEGVDFGELEQMTDFLVIPGLWNTLHGSRDVALMVFEGDSMADDDEDEDEEYRKAFGCFALCFERILFLGVQYKLFKAVW